MPDPSPQRDDGYGLEDEPAPPPPVARQRPSRTPVRRDDEAEWSFGRGLFAGVRWLVIVTVIATPVWGGVLFAVRGALEWIGRTAVGGPPAMAGILIVTSALLAVVAVPTGRALAHRLTERFGIDGPIPAGFGAACAWIIAWGGYSIGTIGLGAVTWVTGITPMIFGLEATAVVVWRTWLDPD